MRDYLLFYVNGQRQQIFGDEAFQMLGDFLRKQKRLTGTKIVCAEGDCGACTVLVADKKGDFRSINSCVANLVQLDCKHILTVESLAKKKGQACELSEVQRAMRECHASQCGFCTPGFVMALSGYFEEKREKFPDTQKAKNQLTGNLCRCTGYQAILQAALTVDPEKIESLKKRYHSKAIAKDLAMAETQALKIVAAKGEISAPKKAQKQKEQKILAGGTDIGVLLNKGKMHPAGEKQNWLSLHLVKELSEIETKKDKIHIGANVKLEAVEKFLEKKIPEFSRILRIFASPQIKHMATLVGNIANGSPIADTLPALAALDAEIVLQSPKGKRKILLLDFYKAYKEFDLRSNEYISHVILQKPAKNSFFKIYKVSQRKDLDISYISAAYLLEFDAKKKIQKARIAYGGMAGTVVRLKNLEAELLGESLSNQALWQSIAHKIPDLMQPRSDVRGSALGRRILSASLWKKFEQEILV